MKKADFKKFDNLSSHDKIQKWAQECYDESESSYLICSPEASQRTICVDIGANVGGFCLYAQDKFDEIYAFEPCYENYVILENIIKANGVNNVVAFQNAVHSESDKLLNLYKYNNNCSGDVICQEQLDTDQENNFTPLDQSCETVSLEDIIGRLQLPYIDYLKIDCEGGEYEIFKNFKDYDKVRIICMEVHGSDKKLSLIRKLEEHYYVIFPDLFKSDHKVELPTLPEILETCKGQLEEEQITNNTVFLCFLKNHFEFV